LDSYLKTQRLRFQEVFESFDADASGKLDGPELTRLIKELLPTVTLAELRYFQVLARPCVLAQQHACAWCLGAREHQAHTRHTYELQLASTQLSSTVAY
jgi:hypothetical protein